MEKIFQFRWQEIKAKLLQPDELPGVVKLIEKAEVFKDWKRSWRPPSISDSLLTNSIDIACADPNHPYVGQFRSYALQVLDKALKDTPRWAEDADWGKPPFGPAYWFETVTSYEQAHAWQQDEEIDTAPVLDACCRYVAAVPSLKGGVLWSHSSQVQMLIVVLWLLYVGAIDEAKQALALPKRYHYAAELNTWTRELVRQWPSEGVATDAALAHFDSLYQRVRDPDWRKSLPSFREQEAAGQCYPSMKSLFRLQLALLRRRLQGRSLAGQWGRLIDEMAA